jgi:glutamine synthetase
MVGLRIQDREDALRLLEERKVSRVYVALTDVQGQLRGKSVSRDKFRSMLDTGFPVTPNFAIADFTDVIPPIAVNAAGVRMGEGLARIVPDTCREIPWEAPDRNLIFLAEYAGEEAAFDPRQLYRRIEARARGMGFTPLHACEYECTVLEETHASLHQKGFRDLRRIGRDSNYLSILRHTQWSEFWQELVDAMEQLGVAIDACHFELGAGVIEAVIRAREGVRAADDAAIYKTFAKAFAQRRGLLVTFMARLSHDTTGHSGHVHVSLRDVNGTPVFHDPGRPDGISETFGCFIGGMQRLLPELFLMLLPNVNSFRRFGERAFAFEPGSCRWGIDNRTVALRVIPGGPDALHLENRIAGADANPYLALAAVLAAGLWGIEQRIAPGAPLEGSAYETREPAPAECRFPETFAEAIARFHGSVIARELFGEAFVEIFSASRRAQEREFRDKVSEFELRRFLELA